MNDIIGFGTGNNSFKDTRNSDNNQHNEKIYKQINDLRAELQEVKAEIAKEKAARKAAKKVGGSVSAGITGGLTGVVIKNPKAIARGASVGGLFGGWAGKEGYNYYDENISEGPSLSFLETARSSIENQIQQLERQIK